MLREERLREEPAEGAPGSRKLPPGTLVHVVKFAGTFAVVAIEGQQVGYIPQAALLKIAQ